MAAEWFYLDANSQQVGPIEESTLNDLYGTSQITNETLVWKKGIQEWVPYASLSPSLSPESAKAKNELDTRSCPHCGKEIKKAAKLCKHCKQAVSPAEFSDESPSRLTTFWGLLAGQQSFNDAYRKLVLISGIAYFFLFGLGVILETIAGSPVLSGVVLGWFVVAGITSLLFFFFKRVPNWIARTVLVLLSLLAFFTTVLFNVSILGNGRSLEELPNTILIGLVAFLALFSYFSTYAYLGRRTKNQFLLWFGLIHILILGFLSYPVKTLVQIVWITGISFYIWKKKPAESKLKKGARVLVLLFFAPYLFHFIFTSFGLIAESISYNFELVPQVIVHVEKFFYDLLLLLCMVNVIAGLNGLFEIDHAYTKNSAPPLRLRDSFLRKLVLGSGIFLVVSFFLPFTLEDGGFSWEIMEAADAGSPAMFSYLHLIVGGLVLISIGIMPKLSRLSRILIAGIVCLLPVVFDSVESILTGVAATTITMGPHGKLFILSSIFILSSSLAIQQKGTTHLDGKILVAIAALFAALTLLFPNTFLGKTKIAAITIITTIFSGNGIGKTTMAYLALVPVFALGRLIFYAYFKPKMGPDDERFDSSVFRKI